MTDYIPLILLALAIFFIANRIASRRRHLPSKRAEVSARELTNPAEAGGEQSQPQSSTEFSNHIEPYRPSSRSNMDTGRSRTHTTVEANACWLPRNRGTLVHNTNIGGGLIYVGHGLKAANEYSVEPALIDPSLTVDMQSPDHAGESMSYWPSYDQISPRCRGAYLIWLADGRRARAAYIGYVFLFLYGLERRIFCDIGPRSGFEDEIESIRDETEQLLAIYSENGSFNRYASRFLSALAFLRGIETDRLPRLPNSRDNELPLALKAGLGKLVEAGQPIPPDWAHAWVKHDREIPLRTPARRCPDLFSALFAHLYRQRFGNGMILKPNKTLLEPHYWPASPSLRGIELALETKLCDVTALKRPRNALSEIADEATALLDPYSRQLAKGPHMDGSLEVIALLPNVLVDETQFPAIRELRDAVTAYLTDAAQSAVPMSFFVEHLSLGNGESLAKKDYVLLAQILEKIDIGMAPDARFDGVKAKPSDHLVLFTLGERSPTAPSPAYNASATMIRLATMVSTADGIVAEDERRALDMHIDGHQILSSGERTRLHAYKEWMLTHDEGTAGLKAQLEVMSASQVESVGEYLITIAAADGHIDREEIKMLEKLYKRLGLDPSRVVPALHSVSSEPVTVRPTSPQRGYAIPISGEESNTGEKRDRNSPETLDLAVLERKLADTKRVSALLGGIFSEQKDNATSDKPPSTTLKTIGNLDRSHSGILTAFGAKDTWDRRELEALAKQQGLLLDGALDRINEAAFDKCDAPCIDEDDDQYTLDGEIYEELMA
jgi:uncharacterized tellurite resistance protein B-like protein